MIKVMILTTPGCSNCEAVKRTIEKLMEEYSIKLEIIDVTENPEVLQKYPVMSAPGIVINGKLEFMGGATEDQLRRKLEELK